MSISTAKFEASYVIYSGSNGVYYAKNGNTGKVMETIGTQIL